MQSHVKALVFLLLSAIYIAGCGQKGPLFLPGNTNEVSTSIPRQQAERDEDDDDDEKPITRY
jgi:predicted small lipoprotein YifL